MRLYRGIPWMYVNEKMTGLPSSAYVYEYMVLLYLCFHSIPTNSTGRHSLTSRVEIRAQI